MIMSNSVVFNLAQGEALIAGTIAIPVTEAGAHGELQTGGGTILRPLTFGERSRSVGRSAISVPALCQGILQTAQVRAGGDPPQILEVLALALAGADQEPVPPFAESVLRVARATGWSFAQIYDAEAAEIDRLAVYLGGPAEFPPDAGWNRIVFRSSPTPGDFGGDVLDYVRHTLANQLLRRADPPGDPRLGAGGSASAAGRFLLPKISVPLGPPGSREPSDGPNFVGPGVWDPGPSLPKSDEPFADGIARADSAADLTASELANTGGPAGPPDQRRNSASWRRELPPGSNRISAEGAEYSRVPDRGTVNKPVGYIRVQTRGRAFEDHFRPDREEVIPMMGGMVRIAAANTAPVAAIGGLPPVRGAAPTPAGVTGAPVVARSGSGAAMVPTVAPAQTPAAKPRVEAARWSNRPGDHHGPESTTTSPDFLPSRGASFCVADMADALADIIGGESDLRGLER
jgi:hypothetical protein